MRIADRDSLPSLQDKRNEYANRVREKSDKKMEQEDLRYAENAWLFGLHLYGMFDAFGIWYNNNHRSVELRSMKKAVLWGIIPGFGQMYNGEFGKAGLLYMGIIGATTSIRTSQNMVNYYLDRKHLLGDEAQFRRIRTGLRTRDLLPQEPQPVHLGDCVNLSVLRGRCGGRCLAE